jgi:hypothetical protein
LRRACASGSAGGPKVIEFMEHRAGIEPANTGFASNISSIFRYLRESIGIQKYGKVRIGLHTMG